MSSVQRGTRRLSARLQDKEEPQTNGAHVNGRGASVASAPGAGGRNQDLTGATSKKRKNGREPLSVLPSKCILTKERAGYDEEDDGFAFTRVKKRQTRTPTSHPPVAQKAAKEEPVAADQSGLKSSKNEDVSEPAKKRRNKMSFSTPKIAEPKPVRRSKRLSDESSVGHGSPRQKTRRKDTDIPGYPLSTTDKTPITSTEDGSRDKTPPPNLAAPDLAVHAHPATRIALPFADTPVIRRNKAMREGKSGKGERRSSLGLRGRRASSLIETGNSNGELLLMQ